MNRWPCLVALLLLFAPPLPARVISYAPYTDSLAIPAIQDRTNRHFVLVEGRGVGQTGPGSILGQVVLYAVDGGDTPAVIYPQDRSMTTIFSAAVREDASGTPSILIQALVDGKPTFLLSTDAGVSWRRLELPNIAINTLSPFAYDTGGPYAAAKFAQVRIGNANDPFVVALAGTVYAINSFGTVRPIHQASQARLIGSDREGRRFLIASANEVYTIDTSGSAPSNRAAIGAIEGWITPDGAAYVLGRTSNLTLWRLEGGVSTEIMNAPTTHHLNLFAVPTFDFSGAWIIRRGPGIPTSLLKHTRSEGLVRQWEDITAPEVEALHAGSSGSRLLIQVHRPRRQADQRLFIDPALAIWNVGQPAPRQYDELFLNEEMNKGFVHLDVEKVAAGEPFIFDSGVRFMGGGGGVSAGGGGGDVVQEWGVVRGSLKQKLVLPSVGRTAGAFGSYWVTDLILYNPYDETQALEIMYLGDGEKASSGAGRSRALTLAAREIRLINDALLTIFGIDTGLGAFFITPAKSISVTSRTYSRSANGTGTFGFGMNATDYYAGAASPRFPVTFSGAFLGSDFRTNLVLTDTSARGTSTTARAASFSGPTGRTDIAFATADGAQIRINGLATQLGLLPFETGALTVRPVSGSAIASLFVTDNRTNDATYFPPDLPSSVVRTIPAIGHVDGANDSRFRSDLYLYNPSSSPRGVTLQMTPWDSPLTPGNLALTLLPNEARVIRDVLQTAFGRTGIARLRYQSFGDSSGVRVTSRTYSVDANGGTYGFLMPPLNNFQGGGSGDTLEILGSVADDRFRTNIGLVELTAFGVNAPTMATAAIEIINAAGQRIDRFVVNVPIAGGTQLNDVFRARGITATGPVLIRVSPLSGLIGAYGAVVDNTTNDSTYLAANLAASN